MFTQAQLVSFGNFLLSTYGVYVFSTDGKNTPLFQREVHDADFQNWKENQKPNSLQSQERQPWENALHDLKNSFHGTIDYKQGIEDFFEAMGIRQLLNSEHQRGDSVWLKLWSAKIVSEIHAVHFFEGKVKYDLIVHGDNGEQTRLYNVDSNFVKSKI